MSSSPPSILVLGYGNPGRLDDGLGPAAARRIAHLAFGRVWSDWRYQLNIEDAMAIAEYDCVLFIDATVDEEIEDFALSVLEPQDDGSFTTHSVSPQGLLHIAESQFGSRPAARLLQIRGERFDDFGEKLSDSARRHLEAALEYVVPLLRSGSLHDPPPPQEARPDSNSTA